MIKYLFAYRYAFLASMISAGALFVMLTYRTPYLFFVGEIPYRIPVIFFGSFLFWLVSVVLLLLYVERSIGSQKQHLVLLVSTMIGSTGISSLVDRSLNQLVFLLISLSSLAVALIFIAGVQKVRAVRFSVKRWRRVFVIIWSFNMYAAATSLLALSLFFQNVGGYYFALLFAIFASVATYQVWRLYYPEVPRAMSFWTLLMGLLMFELSWVLDYMLPFGYLAMGLLVAWIWYILQLLIRFHISEKGILWKHQWKFVAINLALYLGFLFLFVRWK